MEQGKKLCEKAFWLLLLASPLLDMINGIWTYLRCGGDGGMLSSLDIKDIPGMSPSFLLRVAFLLVMAVYVLLCRNWRAVGMFAAIGVTWCGTVAYEHFRGAEFSLRADVQYIVRFCYCLLVLVVYFTMLKGGDGPACKRRVDQVLCLSLLVLGLGVLIPYILGMGFFTYADPLGYRGSRGFFYAGNDITAVMMLLLPVVLAGWMGREKGAADRAGWLQAVSAGLGFVALLIIGTKTAFLAAGVTLAVLAGYSLLRGLRARSWTAGLRLLTVLAIVLAVLCLMMLICETSPITTIWKSLSATSRYIEIADTETVIFSGRTSYLDQALAQFRQALPVSALVGIGRGSQGHIIEMDPVEVLVYYGLLGALTMLWLYVLQGVRVIIDLFRAFRLEALACAVSLGLCASYCVLAGHVLFSVTAGFYFAFMLAYARAFCSKDGRDKTTLL